MTNRNPFYELEQFFNAFTAPKSKDRSRHAFLPGLGARRYPKINLYDDAENYYIEALAPGIDPSKIDASVTGKSITISGEKAPLPNGVTPESFHRSERATGRFLRTVELPGEIDSAKVNAEYKNGVLIVTLSKAESARTRSIDVKVA